MLIGLAAAGLFGSTHADSLVVNPAARGTFSVNGGSAPQGIRIVIDNNGPAAPPRADSLVVYPGDGSTFWMNWGGIKSPYPAQMLPVAIPARSCQIVPVITACKTVTINVPAGTYWTGRWAYRPFASGVYLAGDTPVLIEPMFTTEPGQDKVRFTLGNNNLQQSYAYVWIEVAPGQNKLFSDYARGYAYGAQLQSPPWTVFTGRVRIDELQRLRSPASVQIDPRNKAVNVVTVPATGGEVQAQFAPTNRFVLQNVNSLYCAAANNNDPPQGARVVQADCGADVRGDRDWHVGKTFGNVTMLQVSSTGRCMDLPDETRDYGAGVVVGQCTAHDSQRWYWTPNAADNTYTVVNANSGYCLDIEGGGRKEYVRLVQTTCTGSPSQKWRLIPKLPTWTQAAPLPRAYASSADFARVVLADGRVLIAGGKDPDTRQPLRDAWLYDPATNKWTAAATMNGVQDSNNPAALLRDGRVLIAGSTAAEIYDPATNRWWVADGAGAGLDPVNAVVLLDGRVFIIDTQRYTLYDPRSGRASPPRAFGGWQFGASLTLLDSGQVFIAGRGSHTALLYDPITDRMKTIPHPADTGNHVATKLASGKVLLAGGVAQDGSVLNTAEVFDPQTETFTRVASMRTPRSSAAGSVAAAFNGNALVVDGRRADQLQLRSAEAYDPVRNIWWVVPAPAQAGYWSGFDNWSTLLALPDGRFVAMGANSSSGPTPPTVEIYAP